MKNVPESFLLVCLPVLLFQTGLSAGPSSHSADENEQQKTKKQQAEGKNGKIEPSVTKHEMTLQGTSITYRATAGTMNIQMGQDKKAREAHMFYVAYERTNVSEDEKRPIMFSFNGGPGSSSVWLHLGALGPKRVRIPENTVHPKPPYTLTKNPFSLLPETDLVFIDPVSTGYSQAAAGTDASKFHGVQKDITSVGRFIHNYITENNRWASPKFIIGESYGTTRAAGLALHLQERYGMDLNGIALVSAILNFQLLSGNMDLKSALRLPTYTATAWYNDALSKKMLNRDLQDVLQEVESFAENEYIRALMKGDALSDERRNRIVKTLASYTGLSTKYIEKQNLRIPLARFNKQLLREQNLVVGRFDSRFRGEEADQGDDSYRHDPSYSAISGAFTSGMYRVLRNDLNVQTTRVYEVLTGDVHPWDPDPFQSVSNVDMTDRLRKAMHQNPHLKVLVASGYYDHATPYFATEYTINHMDLSEETRENITMSYYRAGHMMYLTDDSMARFQEDLTSFLKRSTE